MPTRTKIALGGVIGALSLVGAAAVATATVSVIIARKVLVPPSRREEDVAIRSVDLDEGLIVLDSTADSRLPGEYSFWFSRESGHARIGEIVATTATTVTRRILGVDSGDLATARRGRLTGWFYLTPADLEVPFEDVAIATPLGDAPAWLIPPADAARDRWAIHVHGRAVRRPETLRAVPIFREAGFTSLVVSYRNDHEAPRSDDFRYALGDREWLDVDAAMRYAVDNGATQIVLVGWSMGGATVLQALTRSSVGDRVAGVVLESPVVDWIAALDFQVRLRRLPVFVRSFVIVLFKSRWGRFFTGLAEPLDIDRLDFVTRANELDRPMLILHSDDDGFVPSTASRALAIARPDIVSYEAFEVARHTKLWNYDRARWEGAIRSWLATLPTAGTQRVGRQRA
ncbi:alpha/beta hydrolase family protein [Pseudolysinimonas yzui]|uniref:Alpha/beta hydrolase n=1 Tax=Pseudolysinimonas yzui TaxID=2708254 RepID=A0A8J3GNR9_9MICO|nr:alpha/beta fold hydrolase [Pseudolysinimonas yzui]GHF08467.1 alpha/beta hydrolase [Pseudolysinimonas yzui]